MGVVRKAIERVNSQSQEQANIDSISTARLTTVLINVAHGFSGSKGRAPKIKVQDFLPFPDWEPTKAVSDGPSDTTSKLLIALLKKRRIPAHVFTALRAAVTD